MARACVRARAEGSARSAGRAERAERRREKHDKRGRHVDTAQQRLVIRTPRIRFRSAYSRRSSFNRDVPGRFRREKLTASRGLDSDEICFERSVVTSSPLLLPPPPHRDADAPRSAPRDLPSSTPPPPKKTRRSSSSSTPPPTLLESPSPRVDRRRPPRRVEPAASAPAVAVLTGGATGPFVFFSSRRRTHHRPRARLSHMAYFLVHSLASSSYRAGSVL